MTSEKLTAAELHATYDRYCEVSVVDGVIDSATIGKSQPIRWLTAHHPDGTAELVCDDVKGWGAWSHRLLFDTGAGMISMFARLRK